MLEDRQPGLRSIRSTMSTLPPYMLQEYRQAIIAAAWMIISSLIPEDVGAIFLCFLICVHVMRPMIEYHLNITLSAQGRLILCLIRQAPMWAGAILLGFLMICMLALLFGSVLAILVFLVHMPAMRPQDRVWSAAFLFFNLMITHIILLGFLKGVHAMRPRIFMKTLQLRFSSLEEKMQDGVESGIMRQSDTTFTNQFTRDVRK